MTTNGKGTKIRNRRAVYVTEADMDRLLGLLRAVRASGAVSSVQRAYLDQLEEKLELAEVLAPAEVPGNVITMNSEVRLKDPSSGEELVCKLTFPASANPRENRISILAPAGIGMLGKRVGETVEFHLPTGPKKLKVESILYQPEAAKDYEG